MRLDVSIDMPINEWMDLVKGTSVEVHPAPDSACPRGNGQANEFNPTHRSPPMRLSQRASSAQERRAKQQNSKRKSASSIDAIGCFR